MGQCIRTVFFPTPSITTSISMRLSTQRWGNAFYEIFAGPYSSYSNVPQIYGPSSYSSAEETHLSQTPTIRTIMYPCYKYSWTTSYTERDCSCSYCVQYSICDNPSANCSSREVNTYYNECYHGSSCNTTYYNTHYDCRSSSTFASYMTSFTGNSVFYSNYLYQQFMLEVRDGSSYRVQPFKFYSFTSSISGYSYSDTYSGYNLHDSSGSSPIFMVELVDETSGHTLVFELVNSTTLNLRICTSPSSNSYTSSTNVYSGSTIYRLQQSQVDPYQIYILTSTGFTRLRLSSSPSVLESSDSPSKYAITSAIELGEYSTDTYYLISYVNTQTNQFYLGISKNIDNSISGTVDSNIAPFNSYKVKYDANSNGNPNESSEYKIPNKFSLSDLSLFNNKSLKVPVSGKRELQNNIRCNETNDFLKIALFYYCVTSCEHYFSNVVLEKENITHSCKNKISYNDYGKNVKRCIGGYVESSSNCPNIQINEHSEYRFVYTWSNHTEYRFDCRTQYVKKLGSPLPKVGCDETGECTECDFGANFVIHSSKFKYCDQNEAETSVWRKYCTDSCSHSGFDRVFAVQEGSNTVKYCTESCLKANHTTTLVEERKFYDIDDTNDQCKSVCPSERRFIKTLSETDSVDTVKTEPICATECPANSRVFEEPFTAPDSQVVTYKYCLFSCADPIPFTLRGDSEPECLSACPEEMKYTFSEGKDSKICALDCPSGKKFIPDNPDFTGNPLDRAAYRCDSSCTDSLHFRFRIQNETMFCLDNCPPIRPFIGNSRECLAECPNNDVVRPFTGVIDKMEYNSEKGGCYSACLATEFLYFSAFTRNHRFCLEKCYTDKPLYDEHRTCFSICPEHIRFANKVPEALTFPVSSPEGVCKSACDAGYSFRYNKPDNSHQFYCLERCELPKIYYIDHSTYQECLYECPFHLRYSHPTTKQCLQACPSTHPYYDQNGNCLEKCEDSIFEWECLPKCKPGYNYTVDSIHTDPCQKAIFGWDCTQNRDHLQNHLTHTNHYCSKSCLHGQNLHQVLDFDLPSETAVCKADCLQYKLAKGFFPTQVERIYCIPECPELYLKEIRSSTDKWCKLECDKQSPWKFTVLNDSCVEDCIELGFKYISEEYECLEECSHFINNQIWCVKACPKDKPFVFEQHCVAKCPLRAQFVNDFLYCVPQCETFRYGIYCVDRCDSEELVTYFSEFDLVYKPLKFVHSTLMCAESCDEPGFRWINEVNNRCIASCPMPCFQGICPQPEMKYKEPTKYCRNSCKNENYQFLDKKTLNCLPICSSTRRFFVEEDKICLEKCSNQYRYSFKKSVCREEQSCDQNCNQHHYICTTKCPKEAQFTIEEGKNLICLCQCPEFYLPDKENKCILHCDNKKGLFENENKDSCETCPSEKPFLFENECIVECPKGYESNPFRACLSCKDLNLWQNDQFECVPRHECDKFALFDDQARTCTKCRGNGLMLVKDYGKKFKCQRTTCSGGHIEYFELDTCFYCPEGWFYLNQECYEICPKDYFNDYNRFICTENCFESCSEDCCLKGNCSIELNKASCTCLPGFYGKKCDVDQNRIHQVIEIIGSSVIKSLEEGTFGTAQINSLFEYYFYNISVLDGKRELVPSSRALNTTSSLLVVNLKEYIATNYVKFAFQTNILQVLDCLLHLNLLEVRETGNDTNLKETVAFIDSLTDDIQLFLTQSNEITSFERVFHGKYTGEQFTFRFGTNIQDVDSVNINTCLEKIGSRLDFPFKLLTFSQKISELVEKRPETAFSLGSQAINELTIYTEAGIFPIKQVCKENYIDTVEQVKLPDPTKAISQQKVGINVFDLSEPVFSDKCVPFRSEDGKDLTIKERKQQLFENPADLCKESSFKVCSVTSITDTGEAICSCTGIKDRRKSEVKTEAISYPENNFVLMFCLTTFKEAYLLGNIGFYIVFVSFIAMASIGIHSMFTTDSQIRSEKRFEFVRNDVVIFEPDKMNLEVYFSTCFDLKNIIDTFTIEMLVKKVMIMELSPPELDKLVKSLPTLRDLRELPFESRLDYDKRSDRQFFSDTFMERNPIASAFLAESLVYPKYFRIMFFVTEFNLNITMNAFFIDDSLIERFNEAPEAGFLYSLQNELTKSVWAFLTTKLIMTVFRVSYYVSKKNYDHLIRRMHSVSGDYVMRAFNLFMLKMRTMSLIFSFLVVVFNCFCGYFVVIFCEIYENSIDIWINGIYMGWLFDFVITGCGIPILISFSRFLAKKDRRLTLFYRICDMVDYLLTLDIG